MNYDTFIFDLDGTLLDTLDDLAAAVNHALAAYGMPLRSREEVRSFVGNGVRLLMERAVPGGAQNPLFDQAFAEFRAYYMEHSLDTTRPYDGIMPMLGELHRRGCRMAVVSNKFMTATQELIQHFFPMIPVAIGEHEAEGIRKKPAPDTVFEALRQLNDNVNVNVNANPNAPLSTLNAQRSTLSPIYVGDSDVDVATARNAGLPCISVLWGFRNRAFLEAHGATTFITRPAELLTFVRQ